METELQNELQKEHEKRIPREASAGHLQGGGREGAWPLLSVPPIS